eukprot:753537-Hanusia_phi.AAC.2
MVSGSKPTSPAQVPAQNSQLSALSALLLLSPSKAGVLGRPAKGIAVTPLPWIFPSPKSCMLMPAWPARPELGSQRTSLAC